jgi:hypothetical protein
MFAEKKGSLGMFIDLPHVKDLLYKWKFHLGYTGKCCNDLAKNLD